MTKPSLSEVATKIALAYAPELLPEADLISDPLDKYIWEPRPLLVPGMDYHDGTLYMTFPLQQHVTKVKGKGKDAEAYPGIDRGTICVTSDREHFDFNEQEVFSREFNWASTFLQNPNDSSWFGPDIKAFLKGETEAPDPFEIWGEIRQIYAEHIEFSEERHYDLMSLYVMLTYVFRLFQATPYLHFNGTANAGKSQNMAILNALSFNPIWQSNITPASLFRTIAGSVGTVLLDEAESWESEGQKEVLGIIKAGYTEGSGVMRTERDSKDRFTPINYPAFSPKVFASIAPQDIVLQTRTIVINMRPAIRKLPSFDYRDKRWRPVRNRLYLWAMHHAAKIEPLLDEWEQTKRHEFAPDIQNRQWQLAKPLLVLADYIGGKTLIEPLSEWLTTYWREQVKNNSVIDRQALLLRCLPRVLDQFNFVDDHWYYLKDIHSTVLQYLDEDQRESYKTRSVMRHLQPLGFPDKRNSKSGNQIRLDEEQIRASILQRRIDPFPEDSEWLAGNVTYQTAAPTPIALQDLWTQQGTEDEEDTT